MKWLVREGEEVKADQTLVIVETDKVTVEVPSPRPGIVLKIPHLEGEMVKVGETLVVLGERGEELPKPEAAPPSVTVVGILEEAPAEGAPPEGEILAAPATRRIARELGVDLVKVKGTGPGGRITEEDVRGFAQQLGLGKEEVVERAAVKVTRKYDLWGYVERVPLRGIRKTTARRMVKSKYTAPHVTHMDDADVTDLVRIRESRKVAAEKVGVHLTYLPFFIKAVVGALKENPSFNASLDDEHEEIVLKKYYNIGVAVDTGEGLVVPVVKGADQKSILALASELEKLVKSAIGRKLDLADLRGGTFTITNIGVIGGTYSAPIINHPEVAILATGKIQERPVVRGGKIEVRSILPLALSFDHRVADGAGAARFVNAIKERLENPELMLVEMGEGVGSAPSETGN